MQIKNIVLPNENYINKILNILCKNNISYVYIKEDNELHYDNFIVRFFCINNLLNEFDFEMLDKITYDIYTLLSINEKQEYFDFITKKNYEQLKKDDYKKISNLINIKLKDTLRNNKILKKQLNPTRKIYKKL